MGSAAPPFAPFAPLAAGFAPGRAEGAERDAKAKALDEQKAKTEELEEKADGGAAKAEEELPEGSTVKVKKELPDEDVRRSVPRKKSGQSTEREGLRVDRATNRAAQGRRREVITVLNEISKLEKEIIVAENAERASGKLRDEELPRLRPQGGAQPAIEGDDGLSRRVRDVAHREDARESEAR